MQTLLIVLLSIFSIMEFNFQNKPTDRQPVVAGSFYPGDKETLTKELSKLFTECKKTQEKLNVRAIISPHAGYVFSGKVAAAAFSTTPKNAEYKNIFIIGSSHVMSFEGASVYNTGDFVTPLGKVTVNKELATKLKNENKVFNFPVNAHAQDHCLEVQIPFIQYYYTNPQKIVPIIIGGTDNASTIKRIAEALKPYFTSENLFVISSDFSHYPAYKDAVVSDNLTTNGIISGDPSTFLAALEKNAATDFPGEVTSMCGWTSGLTLLYLSSGNNKLEYRKIDYCNSGDTPYGEKDRVVGYNAIALIEKNTDSKAGQKTADEFSFTKEEKEQLFSIARNAIRTKLYENKEIAIDEKKIPEALKRPLGAFVTLKINGVLRGCIGRFISSDPLYDVVRASALSSAFEDYRFSPLTKAEYDKVDVEITVLGPMKKINNINEIILGKHGIYIKKDIRSGTMLPQVPIEYGWTAEEFLSYTSRDKAGIGWDGWKSAEIYIYEGLVLEENKK
jgi:AmmeMemoRadiSam system protein B/AmmeMemoRadiSam system protein A